MRWLWMNVFRLGLSLAAQFHSCADSIPLCQPPGRATKKRKKKKQGSISRPLAFCLNSSWLRLSPLYREWKRVGGEGGQQAEQRGEMQSNRQVMN